MIISLLLLTFAALAQEPPAEEVTAPTLEETVSELRMQVDRLELRVNELENQNALDAAQSTLSVETRTGLHDACEEDSYNLEMTPERLGHPQGHNIPPMEAHVYFVKEPDGRHEYQCLMIKKCKPASSELGGDEVCVDYSKCCDSGLYVSPPPFTGRL